MISKFISKKCLLRLLIVFLISAAIIGIYVGIMAATHNGEINTLYETTLIGYIIGFISILIGWIVGNRITYQYRRENKDYNGPIPIEVLNKKIDFRSPFVLNGLVILTVTLLIELIVTLL